MEENNQNIEVTEIAQEDLDFLDSVMKEQHKEIPENSKTLLLDENTSRFSGAIWHDAIKEKEVVLAGIGGIGSWVALLLSRMQIKVLVLYDFDTVERVNMAGQLYSKNNIGIPKVDAIRGTLNNYSDFYNYQTYNNEYNNSSIAAPIMICGFDNMNARKTFFNKWLEQVLKSNEPSKYLYIDGRLNAEEFQVLAIKGDDEHAIKEYQEKWLFNDNEVEEATCSYKQTTFMANMIASVMVNIFVNFVANQCNPIFPRDVPFFTSYTADTMFTKTIL